MKKINTRRMSTSKIFLTDFSDVNYEIFMMIFYRSHISRKSSTSSVPDVVVSSPAWVESTGAKPKLASPGLSNGGGAVPNLLESLGAQLTE
jgi:hypothetical protein